MKTIKELWARVFKKKSLEKSPQDINHIVAYITTRPRRICALITYRIIAMASDDQFSDIERFVSNRKRYGQLNLDQKAEISAISKKIIEGETIDV